jgi:uncharacterized iron-regulated membrane protein
VPTLTRAPRDVRSANSGSSLDRVAAPAARWLRQPQQVWLRRVIFQVHLWTGLGLGLYVVVLCVTGSLLVYRLEIDRLVAAPRAVLTPGRTPLPQDELRAAAQRAHPGWTVASVHEGSFRPGPARGGVQRPADPTATIVLERGGETKDRLFDPYTGADLGDSMTGGQWAVLWIVRLHDDLLLDRPQGTRLNAALSLVFTLVVLTGAVVWWPGVSRWRRALGVRVSAGWRRLNWDLHSALGFWLLPFMVMWGVSGWYMGMPDTLTNVVERLSDPNGPPGDRPGDLFLEWLPRLHFGRWRDPSWGPWLKAVWAAAGLVPAVMFVTGALMWWSRVVRPRLANLGGRGRIPAADRS